MVDKPRQACNCQVSVEWDLTRGCLVDPPKPIDHSHRREEMEKSKQKVELIQLAIQRLIDEKKNRENSSAESFLGDDEEQLVLSRLLSQLESLKEDGSLKQPESPSHTVAEVEKKSESGVKVGTEEMVKELKELKRQNSITHWLLSVMIVLTVGWQLSEATLILKVKNGLSNPFRSFGIILAGMLKGPGINGQDEEKQSSSSTKQHLIEAPLLPPLKIPELPCVDLSKLGFDDQGY